MSNVNCEDFYADYFLFVQAAQYIKDAMESLDQDEDDDDEDMA